MTDTFFAELRRELRGLPEGRKQEIIDELEAHVAERALLIGREMAIAALGDARDIGRLYLDGEVKPRRRQGSRTHWLLALERLGGIAMRGISTAALALLGASTGLFLIVMAVMKPFSGNQIGVWLIEDEDFHISLGRSPVPPGEEMLGWWLVPLGLIIGAILIYLTARWSLSSARRLSEAARMNEPA